MIFEKLKLGIVVMEVGMGGRLDATRQSRCVRSCQRRFESPRVPREYGGRIAREKMGIVRRGKPLVLGRWRFRG